MSARTEDSGGMQYLESLPRRWVTLYVPLGVFLFVLLFPFYWMVMTSFKSNEELMSKAANPFWIVKPTLDHFEKLLFRTEYPQWRSEERRVGKELKLWWVLMRSKYSGWC